jgi:CheY-like chemotaxis protein
MHEMLRRVIGEHIDLQCELAGGLPGIYADEANLEQIMMNLVVNARDAMPRGGSLTLRTRAVEIDADHVASHAQARPGRAVALALRDTGCGMSQEVLDHMYEPFFTTKEVGQGSGLGLATVYGIVAQHEGWIEVESAPACGTTFTVYLPASRDMVEPVSVPEGAELQGGSETILVVEDEAAVRKIVTEILHAQGYRVLQATDGPDALSVWSERRSDIDLVVTDIVMPNGLAGHVLADRLLADKKDLKIILSSGYSEDFANLGRPADRQFSFLQKPYRLEELVHKVRACLDN